MSKFKDFFKKKYEQIKSKEYETDYDDERLAPNKFFKPFEYKKWELVGKAFKQSEFNTLNNKHQPIKEFVYRYSKNFGGVVGFLLLFILVVLALIIPFTTNDPTRIDLDKSYRYFFQDGFILGTDYIGRDVWAMLWWGLRYSILLSIVVVAIEVVIGLSMGIMMGQFPKFDAIMQPIIKVINVVPSILILILISIALNPSFWVLAFALSITSWTGMANQIRAQVKRAKNFEWVSASKVLGTKMIKILWNYIPVIIPILVTQLIFTIPGVILSESGLSFIGLSIPNTATLGNMLSEGSKIFLAHPRYVIVPSIFLIIITTSIQLIGSSIQDSLRRQR